MDDKHYKLFEHMRILKRNIENDTCTYCHQDRKVLEHSAYPWMCPGKPNPPPGGWLEPHKDDL